MNGDRRNDQGFAAVLLIVAFGAFFLFSLLFLLLFSNGTAETNSTAGDISENNSTASIREPGSNGPSAESNSNVPPIVEQTGDVALGNLVCVNLPGVRYPRTPALDRRAALLLLRVRQDLDARGVPALTYNWGFRTTCQQTRIDPGPNLKAPPGRSLHEAGAAVDVNGIGKRADSAIIIDAFKRHGWTWLGLKDPPHFEVRPPVVGVQSRTIWIQASQVDFNNPDSQVRFCKGTQCGL